MISEKIYSMVGISMVPTLVEPMILETEPADYYNPGDVVVFIDRNGKTIVHRIVKRVGSVVTTRGDNNLLDDEPIVRQNILGKVVAAYRGEKRYRVGGGKSGYLLHH
jgi:signal peptidase I